MIPYILSLIFLMLASICNSIMDKTTHHYDTSIFRRWDMLWWDGEISWRNKYVDRDVSKGRVKWYFGLNKPVQLTDAFHFFKMLMIIFIGMSITLMVLSPALTLTMFGGWQNYLCNFIGQLTIMGIVWNKTFSLFYDKILVEK